MWITVSDLVGGAFEYMKAFVFFIPFHFVFHIWALQWQLYRLYSLGLTLERVSCVAVVLFTAGIEQNIAEQAAWLRKGEVSSLKKH